MNTTTSVTAMPRATLHGPIRELQTSTATLLEPYGVDRMATYDYVQDEFFVSGMAGGAPYQTRILVRRPREMTRFNGKALAEVSHIWGGTSVWRALNRHLMREGYMWVEIDSQAPSALDLIARSDPNRYAGMTFTHGPLASDFAATIPFTENPKPEDLAREYDEFKQRWWKATPQSFEIIAQVALALRRGLPSIDGSALEKLYFAGISQTGGVVRRFIELHHNSLRGEDGRPLFDGYLPAASGGDALPDIDVPVIEVLGEAEFQSVRWACGVSGQVRGLSHRRPDSHTFRLYEVAGMAHRETRYMSDKDALRLKDAKLPPGARWSRFPNSHVYAALFEQLVGWSEGRIIPPASLHIATVDDTDTIQRDEDSNALGGLRTPHIHVPTSSITAATPVGRPSWYHGNEIPFSPSELRSRYESVEYYRTQVAAHLASLIDVGLYLPVDAEEIRIEAELMTW